MQRAVRQVCLFLACLLVGSVQAVTDGYEGDKAVQILNFDQEGTLNDLPESLEETFESDAGIPDEPEEEQFSNKQQNDDEYGNTQEELQAVDYDDESYMEATENQVLDSEYDDKLDETTAMSLGDEHEVDDNDADMQQNSNVTDSVFNLRGRRRVRRRGMPFRRFIRRRRRGCYRSEVRLVGGQAKNEGRVELRYKGKFGTVCQIGFNMKAAHVVCRQLGYPKAVSVRRYASKYYGKATGPVHLNGITCRGDERSLYHCGHKKIGFSVCPHKLDVGVVCFSGGAKTICDKKRKDNGRICLVKAKYNTAKGEVCGGVRIKYKKRWGSICNDDADAREAQVICRQLNYRTIGARVFTCNNYCRMHHGPIWLSNLGCKGNEQHGIRTCQMTPWGRHNCRHTEDIGVCCKT